MSKYYYSKSDESDNFKQGFTVLSRQAASPTSQDKVEKHITLLVLQAIFILALMVMNTYVASQHPRMKIQAQDPNIQEELSLLKAESETTVLQQKMIPRVAGTTDVNIANLQSVANSEPAPTEAPKKLPKDEYSIAFYGDSMIDTAGERMEYVEHALKEKYPDTNFILYNYGQGANNAEDGLARWNKPFNHIDRNYRALPDVKPDIIVMGSFAYNVFTPHDRDKHWLAYTELVQRAQKITPNVYMLAEIAPKRSGFGIGPNGVNWTPATAYEHTAKIMEQLENVIGLSRTLNVPLIDAYTPSLQPDKKEVRPELVNPDDGIHPSVEGHEFIAKQVVDVLEFGE